MKADGVGPTDIAKALGIWSGLGTSGSVVLGVGKTRLRTAQVGKLHEVPD
jgi:hypothetical protein